MAIALMSLLIERGVRIPAQLSVVGFDDMHATSVVPPLTTISHSLGELGEAAVARALALIGDGGDAKDTVVPSRLVVRASTGPAAALSDSRGGGMPFWSLLGADRSVACPLPRRTCATAVKLP